MATHPEQTRHLAAGAGLLGLQQIEGLQALVSLHIALGVEKLLQFLRWFVDSGNGLFHGARLRPRLHSHDGDHRLLPLCTITRGKWYKGDVLAQNRVINQLFGLAA
jgi:hypothetical protein